MRTILVSTMIFLCLVLQGDGRAQCSKDADCKGNRICVNGVCVEPPAAQKCSKDAECPGNMICNHGVCVKPSSPQSSSSSTIKSGSDGNLGTIPATQQSAVADEAAKEALNPEPANAPTNSNPGLRRGCTGNTFLIDGRCVDGDLVATAGNVGFVLTGILYTGTLLGGGGWAIASAFLGEGDEELRWAGMSSSGAVLFGFLNLFPLAKERHYLNQLGVNEGKGLYRATWIMNLACVGTTGLLAAGYASNGNGVSGTMAFLDVGALLATYVLHIACNVQQRRLLRSYVENADVQQSEHKLPLLTPYASVGPRGGWRAGLTLSY